jgi:outer membrane lipoprotein-sorting protein
MRLLFALAALLIVPQEKDDAESLFKKMEEKIVKAKSLRSKLAGEMEEAKFKLTGDLLLDEGSKVRIDVQGKGEGDEKKALVISDGKKLYMKSNDSDTAQGFDAPETFGKLIRIAFARAGFLSAFEFCDSENRAKTGPETAYTMTGLKLGSKEKVGDRDAQAVTYTVTRKGRDAAATVWIDTATLLPLKRVLKMDGMTLSESYSDLKVDEKIEAARFEIPKDTK